MTAMQHQRLKTSNDRPELRHGFRADSVARSRARRRQEHVVRGDPPGTEAEGPRRPRRVRDDGGRVPARCVLQLRHEPAVLALSRQPLPTLDRRKYALASGVARGAYVLAEPSGGTPDVILIASGSELSLAIEAHEQLSAEGIRSRVVPMPSWEIFDHQTQEYRDSVLPPDVKARLAIE